MNRMGKLLAALLLLMGMTQCKVGKKAVLTDVSYADSSGVPARELPIFINPAIPEPLAHEAAQANPADAIPAEPPAPTALSSEKQALIEELAPVLSREDASVTFSGKAKMSFQNGSKKDEFTALFRLRRDSAISVNITALGGIVSVGKALLTRDSVIFVNHLQKEVTVMPLSRTRELLPAPLTFEMLQNLLLGRRLYDGGQPTDATDFGGTWSIQLDDKHYSQQLAYNKSDSSLRSAQLRTARPGGPAIVIQYGQYESITGRLFARSRAIHILNDGREYYLDMNFSNVSFDQELDLTFSIPASYSRR